MTTRQNNNNIKTYRHEFSKEFIDELSRFSKVHQYDDRHTYKSEWTKWAQLDDIAQAMEIEKRRLEENGYKGDIADKMFKAGRYYFRKKAASSSVPDLPGLDADTHRVLSEESTGTPRPTPTPTPTPPPSSSSSTTPGGRRPYITMSKECIKAMDQHILVASSASSTTEFKPSSCYNDFYQTQMTSDQMTKEIGHIIEKYEKTPGAMTNITPEELTEQIMDKIKKTYKNRYYKYISAHNNNIKGNDA
jgi:hypothetical protein